MGLVFSTIIGDDTENNNWDVNGKTISPDGDGTTEEDKDVIFGMLTSTDGNDTTEEGKDEFGVEVVKDIIVVHMKRKNGIRYSVTVPDGVDDNAEVVTDDLEVLLGTLHELTPVGRGLFRVPRPMNQFNLRQVTQNEP